MKTLKLREKYGHEIPIWARNIFGVTRVCSDSIEFKWGWVALCWGLEFVYYRGTYFDQRITIGIGFGFLVWHFRFPFKTKLKEGCDMPQYGIKIHNNTFWIYLGGKYDESIGQVNQKWITWNLPWWTWEFESREIINKDNQWETVPTGKGVQSWKYTEENSLMEEEPFTYTLRSGKVQERVAQLHMKRITWHRKWFPWIKKTSTDVVMDFNKEVGNSSGSWKGGVVSTGYEWREGETMKETFYRFLIEREL